MCEEVQNSHRQDDELQALAAIFLDDWHREDIHTYGINISSSIGNKVYFQVTLPPTYPLLSPPNYQLSAPWMRRDLKNELYAAIDRAYSEHVGESIIYLWIDVIQDFIEKSSCKPENNEINKAAFVIERSEREPNPTIKSASLEKECDELPIIEHGEPIQDRKSVFQAHVARIVCEKQVKQVLLELKENRKIAGAKHNIYAYRISGPSKNTHIQDCEDDGETKAGSGLLHLLQVLDASDVLVVVTRWYGGIHLGPDRFKHINNAARTLLCKLGFAKSEKRKLQKPRNDTS